MTLKVLQPSISRPGLFIQRQGHVGSRPYKTPTPFYSSTFAEGFRNGVRSGPNTVKSHIEPTTETQGYESIAYAKAFDKLSGKVSGMRVNLGETLGESNKSLDMVINRVGQLARAYKSLRVFDVKGMLREFGYRPRRRNRTWVRVGKGGRQHSLSGERVKLSESELKQRLKEPASVWLEYNLGWSPLVDEIYTSLQKHNEVHPLVIPRRLIATGSHSVNTATSGTSGSEKFGTSRNSTYSVRLMCNVKISDPSKRKFEEYGIVNPVLIAWNLTPMSMFVDYFVKVSSYLNGFTAFYGVTVSDLVITNKNASAFTQYSYGHWSNPTGTRVTESGTSFRRTYTPGPVSLRVPSLFDRAGSGFNTVNRAANGISVLLQFLRK